MDESRKQFEAEMAKLGDCVDMRRAKNGDEEYMAWDVALAWRFWNLSRAAIEVELPPVCDAHSDDIDKGYDICHYRTQECLKNQGIKFKIEGAERWSKIATPLESK
ncbi:hypothetical protein ACY2HL_000949 [Enterobacter roggenkampii]